MKQVLSVILAVVLVVAVGASVVNGTIAGFSDVEFSQGNRMKAANKKNNMNLVISGGPIVVEHAMPCCWKQEDFTLINAGGIDGTAFIHIKNLVCYEDAPGAEMATTEPELVAEEGGWMDILIPPPIPGATPQQNLDAGHALGVDTCNLADYIDVKIWYDDNNDGIFEDPGELVVWEMLSDLECQQITLGFIPAPTQIDGGWGSYFEYEISSATEAMPLLMPLIAGKNILIGEVRVWNDDANLYVEYDTTSTGFLFKETHVYVGTSPPTTNAPGQFPYKHEGLSGVDYDLHTIPLSGINGGVGPDDTVYIAAHASDGETAWAMGESRKLKIELHFPDIPDLTYMGNSNFADWPTNAYQGDYCTFDIEFELWAPDPP